MAIIIKLGENWAEQDGNPLTSTWFNLEKITFQLMVILTPWMGYPHRQVFYCSKPRVWSLTGNLCLCVDPVWVWISPSACHTLWSFEWHRTSWCLYLGHGWLLCELFWVQSVSAPWWINWKGNQALWIRLAYEIFCLHIALRVTGHLVAVVINITVSKYIMPLSCMWLKLPCNQIAVIIYQVMLGSVGACWGVWADPSFDSF